MSDVLTHFSVPEEQLEELVGGYSAHKHADLHNLAHPKEEEKSRLKEEERSHPKEEETSVGDSGYDSDSDQVIIDSSLVV
jgi:hypothetical protein